MKPDFRKAIESVVGEDLETIRRSTIPELRRRAESRHGRPLQFRSRFPFIGRGNVLRDRLVPHEEVERRLDKALGGK